MGQQTSLERHGANKGTAIGRVRGLGSAHAGGHHWLLMQYTSAGALLTTLYLVFSFLLLPDLSYGAVRGWIASPATALALALMVVAVFWHGKLGLQVMIEDYVHAPGSKFAALLLLNLAMFAGAAFALLSILRIALGGGA
ncbi:MAG TPA: succinate dehydrogenase, hydrophobic membrane anchor protein [Croceibacterium sp.]|nr:succinate dehydrogenase, hydrophobic membrane anchor protein [Croceibacterium sp.]